MALHRSNESNPIIIAKNMTDVFGVAISSPQVQYKIAKLVNSSKFERESLLLDNNDKLIILQEGQVPG